MDEKKNYGGLDYFKIIAAFLVMMIHTSPLSSFNADADFLLARVIARVAVPFFLMVTGFFILPGFLSGQNADRAMIWHFVKKTALLYALAIVLYLPIGIYAGHYLDLNIFSALKMVVFDGTFYHLWYFPASIIGVLLLYIMSRRLPFWGVMVISLALYLVGLFGDSYFGVISGLPVLSSVYEVGFHLFSYTRNGLFYVPIFLAMGAWLGHFGTCCKQRVSLVGFILSLLLMVAEGFILRHYDLPRHDSMYLLLLPCVFFLFQLLLSLNVRPNKALRTISTWIYILHPLAIVLIRGTAKVAGLTSLLVENSLVHYFAVSIAAVIFSIAVMMLSTRNVNKGFQQGRAWIELDRNALLYNVDTLRSLLPDRCEPMPAVKAEAYGHGAVLISRELNALGVKAFCVATVSEGVQLRKNGIKGEILVLGYTHPVQFPLLRRYHLIQTIIDYSYAKTLNQYRKKIRVHVGIDTGMHRLGERCENIDALCDIFRMKNLKIEGLFTHLSAADTMDSAAKAFTEAQAQAFYGVVAQLKKSGFSCPKVHLQASYGVLNYPQLSGDYARIGIALYGVLSTKDDEKNSEVALKPVLSVKARVIAVKNLYCGETAGYGLSYVAKQDMKIATLAIGYADGLPRSLSNGIGKVLINRFEAPIIGRVCMDLTLIDVTDVPEVKPGEIAVLIGKSGENEITAGDLAEQTGTITNELLSRLGGRLNRMMV